MVKQHFPGRAVRFALAVTTMLLAAALLYAGESQVDDETCLVCHDGYDATVKNTAHRLGSSMTSPATDVSCSSCHTGAAEHADDPSADNIINPENQTGQEAFNTCTTCHIAHVELDNYGSDPHNDMQLNCAGCHRIHDDNARLLIDNENKFCFQCHSDVEARFHLQSQHPVLADNLTCLSCHRFSKRQDNNASYDFQRVCQDCHPEQAGPYLYEHGATSAYSVQGGGCVECHDPHGSANDRLLKQSGNNLCEGCHFVPRHKTAHGSLWKDYACQSCHSDLHGSFTNGMLLDENLPAKLGLDCYQSGCHSTN